ncbi:hypothetical protein [Embleya sp. NPDC005971]|uniref:hypothetical protein n=1 Tax=Embleya sp. NPDC005971 TaxID=3156724 RepID=UPI0033E30306
MTVYEPAGAAAVAVGGAIAFAGKAVAETAVVSALVPVKGRGEHRREDSSGRCHLSPFHGALGEDFVLVFTPEMGPYDSLIEG